MLRGAVLAGLSALLAAAGHAAGGGTVPDLVALVPVLPLLAWAFTGLASRRRSLVGTVAVLAVGQFVLHTTIELLHPAHTGSTMLAMHAVATVVTAVALRHADRGAAALVAALRRVLPRRLLPLPADRPLRVFAVPGPAVPARLTRAFVVAHARRGPPVTC
ncbi:hypothetical protein GCM10023320_43020 [Pseudonocardia adelaidensis]|uniref:MFS transporter n=1 Tax=Pseudonocardia adelaidensis TaxID=648754 RepID=A0ABP9NNJ2_9PSEU